MFITLAISWVNKEEYKYQIAILKNLANCILTGILCNSILFFCL